MTRMDVAALLALFSAVGCSAAPEGSDGVVEDVGTVKSSLPKRPSQAGGKCNVTFGGYAVIVAGTYSGDGQCCGKALCSAGCAPGEKYIDVCIDCGADADIQCGDGHYPVARLQSVAVDHALSNFRANP